MNAYQKELQRLRPDDEIQSMEADPRDLGYYFIMTAGHGYLVVPRADRFYKIAQKIVSYGYTGALAIYLEEDSEAGEFIKAVTAARADRPESGKLYALTGGTGDKCISNGNTWKESEVNQNTQRGV
jgi:hypothetical protein